MRRKLHRTIGIALEEAYTGSGIQSVLKLYGILIIGILISPLFIGITNHTDTKNE